MKTLPYWIFLALFVLPHQAMAGPGGKIAKVVAESFWGKVALLGLVLLLSPLIAYVVIKESAAKKKALKSIGIAGTVLPDFDWIKLRRRIDDCFRRVHGAWEKGDVSEASEWMTAWYWQNQQMVFLDRWESEGLENICRLYKINSIHPILFSYRCDNDQPGEGSELAVLISADMQDYLARKSDGEVVEGSTKRKEVERVWSFTYENGRWLVAFIDEGAKSLQYIEMMKAVPPIEETLYQPPNVHPGPVTDS